MLLCIFTAAPAAVNLSVNNEYKELTSEARSTITNMFVLFITTRSTIQTRLAASRRAVCTGNMTVPAFNSKHTTTLMATKITRTAG